MKLNYYKDTDSLYIDLSSNPSYALKQWITFFRGP